ncbi:unnamed protein product, partial [Ectocarpus sp. 12 AP-2014]
LLPEYNSIVGAWVLEVSRSETMEGYLRCMNVADLAIEAQVNICYAHHWKIFHLGGGFVANTHTFEILQLKLVMLAEEINPALFSQVSIAKLITIDAQPCSPGNSLDHRPFGSKPLEL